MKELRAWIEIAERLVSTTCGNPEVFQARIDEQKARLFEINLEMMDEIYDKQRDDIQETLDNEFGD